ncbi:unnamed protein product [Cercopithifilaria johnstoni]|uniref:Uncharacterized protein n=1 Tax=Cercopithifilaria johnstoni TaxID=2874296 RepID=A0A8J2Q2B9_9BILA|nr:unnamed protein product [Cercopithifilaria johnstoni]
MILLVTFFIAISSSVARLEHTACEQLIECYAKSRDKTEECLSHNEKRECQNESLQLELKELTNKKISLYENCLREKSSIATAIENAKKKARCDVILKRNPYRKNKVGTNEKDKNKRKNRRSIHKNKKYNTQKMCFREARKLKTYCGQLSKCCTISKLCKIRLNDEKIAAKRIEIKQADEQCRLEHYGSTKVKGDKNRKRNRHHRGDEQRRKYMNQEDSI